MEDKRDFKSVGALLPLQLSTPCEINSSHVSFSMRSRSIGVYCRRFIYLATLCGFSELSAQVARSDAGPCDSRPSYDRSDVGRNESRDTVLGIYTQCETRVDWKQRKLGLFVEAGYFLHTMFP